MKRPKQTWSWWWAAGCALCLTIVIGAHAATRFDVVLTLIAALCTMYFVRGGVLDITRFAIATLAWTMHRHAEHAKHRAEMRN